MHDPEKKKWEAHTDDLVLEFLEVARKRLKSYPQDQRDFAITAISSALIYTGSTILLAELGQDNPEQVKKLVRKIVRSYFERL